MAQSLKRLFFLLKSTIEHSLSTSLFIVSLFLVRHSKRLLFSFLSFNLLAYKLKRKRDAY